MGTKKTLTVDEFEWLLPRLGRMDSRNVDAMRRVLVDGVMQKTVAAELGLTKEAVSAMVSRVWKAHLTDGRRPAGWEKVEVVLPSEMALVVHELAKIARKKEKQ